MILKVRTPAYDKDGNIVMADIAPNRVSVLNSALIAIDGSTTNSGITVIELNTVNVLYTMSLAKEDGETPVEYKIKFKDVIFQLLRTFRNIKRVYYEEPTLQYAPAIPVLMSLRTSVEEILTENKEILPDVSLAYINNKRWKHLFLRPEKVPGNTEDDKKAVRRKLESMMPCMKTVTQDEIDSTCLGIVAANNLLDGNEDEDIESKKKAKPFLYYAEYCGADSDEEALYEVEYLKIPKKVIENGIEIIDLGNREKFDKKIYESMGQSDMLLCIRFPSDKHGDIVLKNKLGGLTKQFDYIYAFVWRKSRKR